MGAVEAIMRGHSYPPRRAAALVARLKSEGASASRDLGREVLSPRERAVIELYAQGYSASEAGREMSLSPKTVEGYIGRAKNKLGLHNRRDIVRFALRNGMLQAEE